MRVWVTIYALSEGIQEKDVVPTTIEGTVRQANVYGVCFHGEGKNWHFDRPSAVARAEQMRLKKIASLRKQIARLEKLTFEERP